MLSRASRTTPESGLQASVWIRDLREERSDNWEVGFTQLAGRRTLLDFNLFRSEVSNSTQRFFVQPNVFQLRNLGDARYQGGELGLRTSLISALQFNANYTYLSRRNQSNPALLMLDTQRHKVYSSLAYRFISHVTLFADFRYEGGRFYQNDGGTIGRASNFATVVLGGSARCISSSSYRRGSIISSIVITSSWMVIRKRAGMAM